MVLANILLIVPKYFLKTAREELPFDKKLKAIE